MSALPDPAAGPLALAARGLAVFPLWSVLPTGGCECRSETCTSPGKHPRVQGWQKEATTDPGTIRVWWKRWPLANVGVAFRPGQCGVDVDPRKGGDDTLAALEKDFGPNPPTWEVSTGGGGRHLYFAGDLSNTAGQLGPGLDTRGAGGYLVAPPSLHASGRRYEWDADGHPDEVPLAALPGWIAGMLVHEEATGTEAGEPPADIAERALAWAIARVKNGRPRNETGFNLACQLRDNRVAPGQAKPVILEYVQAVGGQGDHPYTLAEALHSLQQAFSRAPRAPWTESPVPRVGGGPARPVGVARLEPRAFSDLGNAERFVDDHGDRVLYVWDWGQWLVWNGKVWEKDETGGIVRLAKDSVRKIWEEIPRLGDSEHKKSAAKHALKSEGSGRIESLLSMAQSEATVASTQRFLDTDPWLLNCENGILDLQTGQLGPHDPEKRCTRIVSVPFDPAATCPRWEAFLERVIPDVEVRAFLQRSIGYTLTGTTREQCLFVLYGIGANGKSTFLETLRALWGGYGEQAEPKSFTERKNEQISNDLARLKGARLVVGSETESGARMAESLVKQVTGGEAIVARFLRQEFFVFYPEFKLWLATNHKPAIRGTDLGIWRRIRLVPWDVTIPPEERDPSLPAQLLAELPGILAWAIRGTMDWLAGGLRPPARVLDATDEYRQEMDRLAGFLDELTEIHPTATTAVGVLYAEYSRWAEG